MESLVCFHDLLCRESIVGENAICDFFIKNGKAEALYGGENAALVQEWRDYASTITK